MIRMYDSYRFVVIFLKSFGYFWAKKKQIKKDFLDEMFKQKRTKKKNCIFCRFFVHFVF